MYFQSLKSCLVSYEGTRFSGAGKGRVKEGTSAGGGARCAISGTVLAPDCEEQQQRLPTAKATERVPPAEHGREDDSGADELSPRRLLI